MRRKIGNVFACQQDASAVWRVEAAHNVEERGLAGTVRANYCENLALLDREGDAVDCDETAEAYGEILHGQDTHANCRLNKAEVAGTIPAGRKIKNTIMIAPRTMCS